MTPDETQALHARLLEAFGKGDMDAIGACLAEDVVWRLPGNSLLSGDHMGRAAVLGFLAKPMELTGGTFNLDLISTAANDDGVFAYQRITGNREGKALDELEIIYFRMADGLITEVIHRPDQYALDRVFS